jgi:membrane protease YdiL (CAAX protease family)
MDEKWEIFPQRLAESSGTTTNPFVFIAATAESLPPEVQKYAMLWGYTVLALLPVAVIVFSRLLWQIEHEGPRTRPDLFAMPEILAVCVVFGLFFFPIALAKVGALFFSAVPKAPSLTETPGVTSITVPRLLENMLTLSMPAIGILIIAKMRGGRIRDLFAARRVPFFKAAGIGVGLAVLALCLATLTKFIVMKLSGTQEPQQKLVQSFESALSGGDQGVVLAITLSAVVVAPICEEILFRGSLYPVLARVLGRGPSALLVSIVFALVHDTYSDAPSLAVLALCFTIGYEFTGTLLVPIFMHAAFNGLNLAQQWVLTAGGSAG